MKSLFEDMGGTYTLGADGMEYPPSGPVWTGERYSIVEKS